GLQSVTYQWMKNGAPIAGATSAAYRVASFQASDAGDYIAVITNAYGSVASIPVAVSAAGTTVTGTARLANISTRGCVATGDNIVAGFAIAGRTPRPILIRAIGPSLAAFGVTGSLADPKLTLYRGSTPSETSDNWGS